MLSRRLAAPFDASHVAHLFALLAVAGGIAACGEDASPPPPGEYGAACTTECAEGLSCVRSDAFPGGYCASLCDTGGCPGGALCDPDLTPPLCLQACSSGAACRDGYQCWRGACRPGCEQDSECMGGECMDGTCSEPECVDDDDCPGGVCRMNRCMVLVDAGLQLPLGTDCNGDGDCESGRCLDAAAGGTCTVSCTTPTDCLGGAVEMGCSAVDVPGGVEALCTPVPSGATGLATPCSQDTDCVGRTCQDGQCTEVCASGAECLAGQMCTALPRNGGTFQGCGYAPISGVTIEEVALDTRSLPAGGALEFRRALPSDVVSLTLQARRTSGDPLPVVFGSVQDPTGTSLYDLDTIIAFDDTPNRWLPFRAGESASMLVPNTTPDRVAMRGGQYVWSAGTTPRVAGDMGNATVAFSALIKRAPGGTVSSGTLDVTVFLVGVGVSASAAGTHTKLQAGLGRLDTMLAPTGIRLGDVRYVEIGGADASALAVIDSTEGPDSELARLFSLSEGRSEGRRLNLFMVRSIDAGGDGFAALGIAGGIPGPVGLHGTESSGVVCSFDDAVVGTGSEGGRVVGHILAHEVGHYLGLFHSTERLRPCGPGEEPDDCAPYGGGDTLADTSRGDRSNLMYFSIVGAGTNDRLSAGQGRVMRNSALVGP